MMKQRMKRSISMMLALLMVLSLFVGISFKTDAATVNYQYGSTEAYTDVIKNWGTRGELATFLSPKAEEYYQGISYDSLAALAGSSDTTKVSTSALYLELNQLMSQAHSSVNSYGDARYLMQFTDIEKNGTETTQISSFYSGKLVGPAWDSGSTWNREHVWPDSKGGDAKVSASSRNNESDIMMLRPAPSSENSSRGNKAFGESSGYYFPNLSNTYDVRGDVARTVLYTYVCWGTEESAVLNNIWGIDGVIESLDVLLTWMEEDPVDTWEMGRNDSVESITKTRNVFVDYPELAFELFEVEVPQMNTPSGIAGTAGYEITAVSNNNAYGTVSVNGSNVTAHPAAGYQVAGYEVTSGSAKVTVNGNVFSLSASTDCTIMILFEKIPSFTVQVMENGTLAGSAAVQNGQNYTFPSYTGTVPEGYTFCGWVDAAIEEATSQLPAKIYQPGDVLAVTEDQVYYSLFSFVNSEDQSNPRLNYELVDSAEDLVIGSSYVITAAEYDYAMGNISSSGNNRTQAAVTKDGTALSFGVGSGVSELVLHEGLEIQVTEPEATDPSDSESAIYQKVTSAPEDWSGEYVIVYEDGGMILNGTLTSLDVANNGQAVTITNGSIPATDADAYRFTISAVNGGYSIQSAGGYYIGNTSDTNKLLFSKTTAYANTISMNDDGTVNIIGSGGSYLRYNSSANNLRFRYFKSGTYTGQKAIALYKRTASTKAVRAEQTQTTISTYAFYDPANNGYLYAAASTSNHLKLQQTLNENGSFVITVNSDGTCKITAQGSNTNNTIRYNSSGGIFSCYGSTATTTAVALYVGVPGSGTVYYTTQAENGCVHGQSTTVTVNATCTEAGYVTVTCDACGQIVSEEVLPASGHGDEREEYTAPTCTQQGYTAFYCAVCGEHLYTEDYEEALGHSYQSVVTAPGLSAQGYTTHTCSACGDSYTDSYTAPLANVDGWNLTLGSDLSVNFKINVDASIRDTAKIHISVANVNTVYAVSALTAGADNAYTVSVKVAAAQMTDQITVQIVNGADKSELKTYSVRGYADTVLAGDYTEKTKNLVTQMLHYGAAAQTHFGYNTDNLANAGLDEASQSVPETANKASFSGAVEGISYNGATLLFQDKITVRFYFTVTGDISAYAFTVNGETRTPAKKGNAYYVEFADINPQDLDEIFRVQVNEGLTIVYSPMNYIVNMGQKGTQTMQLLVQALYDYYLAAEAYVG